MEDDKPRKKIPKVKVSLSLSQKHWDKIVKIQEVSEASSSAIVDYVLRGREGLDDLIKFYENAKMRKTKGGKEK